MILRAVPTFTIFSSHLVTRASRITLTRAWFSAAVAVDNHHYNKIDVTVNNHRYNKIDVTVNDHHYNNTDVSVYNHHCSKQRISLNI